MKTSMQTPRSLRALLAGAAVVTMTLGAVGTALAMPGMSGAGGPGMMGGGMMGGPGMHGGGMHGGGMMGGPGLGRMLDGLNATPEQKAQLQQIWLGARTDLKAQREAGAKLREQMQQLFTQPTVDTRAVEALRVQMLAQHDVASKRMSQAMLDASRVLTPEQRKAMADRMTQRRAMHERHRTERESLDGRHRHQ
jgi:Spy/CpxP family protein refolding chaperone